jgi:tetratricopeptide (TPR) repeat protein
MKTLLFLFLFLPFISFTQSQEKPSKLSNKASELFEKGDFKRAIKVYSKIIKSNPKDGMAYYKRSISKSKLGIDFCNDLKMACKYQGSKLGACENYELKCLK